MAKAMTDKDVRVLFDLPPDDEIDNYLRGAARRAFDAEPGKDSFTMVIFAPNMVESAIRIEVTPGTRREIADLFLVHSLIIDGLAMSRMGRKVVTVEEL